MEQLSKVNWSNTVGHRYEIEWSDGTACQCRLNSVYFRSRLYCSTNLQHHNRAGESLANTWGETGRNCAENIHTDHVERNWQYSTETIASRHNVRERFLTDTRGTARGWKGWTVGRDRIETESYIRYFLNQWSELFVAFLDQITAIACHACLVQKREKFSKLLKDRFFPRQFKRTEQIIPGGLRIRCVGWDMCMLPTCFLIRIDREVSYSQWNLHQHERQTEKEIDGRSSVILPMRCWRLARKRVQK